MPPIKVRDAERLLRAAGYRKLEGRGKGSHMVYQNDAGISVTVPSHGEIPTGTWSAIQRQAGLKDQKGARDNGEDAQRLANDGVVKPGGKSGAQSPQPSPGRHDPGRTRGSGRGGR
ncbi:type II toxin-antitoxin system HicA family toxin [Kribbella sp. NPDC058245]|uniref:type II toxin-antitoxin system HicA family toxin n=1 Tax=Kribbella sp. NPDC058245 TaxID=3346399 RepID=UPI0036EFA9EC